MMRFSVLFGDGHVGVDPSFAYIADRLGGGLGLTLGGDGRWSGHRPHGFPGLPAAEAGIEPGARVIRWNDQPSASPSTGLSSCFRHRVRTRSVCRVALITRAPVGTTVAIRFRNPDAETQTVELSTIQDPAGLGRAFGVEEVDFSEMPVTVDVLPSGYGYILVGLFLDDVTLMIDAWEWSLRRLDALEVPGLIVDIRGNPGSFGDLATYFAGAFYDEEFLLAEEFLADRRTFVSAGELLVTPTAVHWDDPVGSSMVAGWSRIQRQIRGSRPTSASGSTCSRPSGSRRTSRPTSVTGRGSKGGLVRPGGRGSSIGGMMAPPARVPQRGSVGSQR